MVRVLLICVAALVITGPLRRPILVHWKVMTCCVLGGVLSHAYACRVMAGSTEWERLAFTLFMAFVLGPLGAELVDAFLRNEGDSDG